MITGVLCDGAPSLHSKVGVGAVVTAALTLCSAIVTVSSTCTLCSAAVGVSSDCTLCSAAYADIVSVCTLCDAALLCCNRCSSILSFATFACWVNISNSALTPFLVTLSAGSTLVIALVNLSAALISAS